MSVTLALLLLGIGSVFTYIGFSFICNLSLGIYSDPKFNPLGVDAHVFYIAFGPFILISCAFLSIYTWFKHKC